MALSKPQAARVFDQHLAGLAGATSSQALRDGLLGAIQSLKALNASDDDLSQFRAGVQRAIDEYPWRDSQCDERAAATDILVSAFDGWTRAPAVQVISCLFLDRVVF